MWTHVGVDAKELARSMIVVYIVQAKLWPKPRRQSRPHIALRWEVDQDHECQKVVVRILLTCCIGVGLERMLLRSLHRVESVSALTHTEIVRQRTVRTHLSHALCHPKIEIHRFVTMNPSEGSLRYAAL